ncbi:MAG: glucose-6-phosphate 1-epimerase [Verrucomicrobiales bacterium]|jgi:glucose-6-phosphate 1-epimerase
MASSVTTSTLNEQFGIAEALSFEDGAGDFTFVKIRAAGGTAEICLHGGHVTSFVPLGEAPVLWLSPEAVYRESKAIRGGVPICWPWFHHHPSDPEKPSHGYARISPWDVVGSSVGESGSVRLELTLLGEIGCELSIDVSKRLALELKTTNRSEVPIGLSGALHSYLAIGDISEVRVEGLGSLAYLDDVDGGAPKLQVGDVEIGQEVDRRYQHTEGEVLVHDGALGRTLRVSKSGSATTVLWNPWWNRAAEIGDMPDDGYQTMLCVEAANAASDGIVLQSGESQLLGTTIEVV